MFTTAAFVPERERWSRRGRQIAHQVVDETLVATERVGLLLDAILVVVGPRRGLAAGIPLSGFCAQSRDAPSKSKPQRRQVCD